MYLSLEQLLIAKQILEQIPEDMLDEVEDEQDLHSLIFAICLGYYGSDVEESDLERQIREALGQQEPENKEDDYVLHERLQGSKFYYGIYAYVKRTFRPAQEIHELKVHNPNTGNNYEREFSFCLN